MIGARSSAYRRCALAVFGLSLFRVVAFDVVQLELFYRTLAFLSIGVCLIAVSFLYARYRKRLQEWI